MVSFCILLAGKYISVSCLYEQTREFCRAYIADHALAELSVTVSPIDIEAERKKSQRERELEGLPPYEFPREYLETLALYRKLVEELLPFGIILFHGSTLSFDGKGYIFTAKSGTGKSTHTRIWRKVFGERVKMINDDKPLISVTEQGITVHGTPWCGKHGLGENTSAPLCGIAVLLRSDNNFAEPLSKRDAFPSLFGQVYRPKDGEKLGLVLSALDKLLSKVPVFRLGVNMKDEAARVAKEIMIGAEPQK